MDNHNDKYLLADDSLEWKLINFFINNPNPTDSQVHKFAEDIGINEHRLEEEVYKLISTFLTGGKFQSEGEGVVYNPDELKMGDDIELEHVNKDSPYAKYISRRIALDHLAEFKGNHYYSGLIKLEKDLDKKMEEQKGQLGGNQQIGNQYKLKYQKYKNKYISLKNSKN